MAFATIRDDGYRAGALGSVVRLHGEYYAKHWGFGPIFEIKVARALADLLERSDATRDGFWVAENDGEIVGSIAIDGHARASEVARLRFFVVDESRQGQGIGSRLIEAALQFCDSAGYRRVFLLTFRGLDAARALYERHDFRLIAEHADTQWGSEVIEQKFVRGR